MQPLHNPSLPHEREIVEVAKLAFEAYQDENYLAVVITDYHDHARWLLQKLRDAVKWDVPDTKIFREGVEVKGGGKVVVMAASNPERLRGMHPTKIVLFGSIGELFYLINASGGELCAVA